MTLLIPVVNVVKWQQRGSSATLGPCGADIGSMHSKGPKPEQVADSLTPALQPLVDTIPRLSSC